MKGPSMQKEMAAAEISGIRATKGVAAIFALAAFAVVTASGMLAGASATRTLLVALVAMGVCHVLGEVLARIGVHAINEAYAQYKRSNPIPAAANPSDLVRGQAGPSSDDIPVVGEAIADNAGVIGTTETVGTSGRFDAESAQIANAA